MRRRFNDHRRSTCGGSQTLHASAAATTIGPFKDRIVQGSALGGVCFGISFNERSRYLVSASGRSARMVRGRQPDAHGAPGSRGALDCEAARGALRQLTHGIEAEVAWPP